MQLVSEMKAHQKKHFHLLERVQMESSSGNMSLSKQNNLAPEVKKIWSTTVKKFEKGKNKVLLRVSCCHFHTDFIKQKCILRDDIKQRMDKNSPWDDFKAEIYGQVH